MTGFLIFTGIFIVSYLGVVFFLRWSFLQELLDFPNERSSHTDPTPRGGGLVIVIVSLVSYSLYASIRGERFVWGYLIGAILIAAISLRDDIRSVSFVWRFLVHSVAALLVIYDAGFWQSMYIPVAGITIDLGRFGAVLAFLWMVWLTNAYNFMDGIDGISGVQALTAGFGWLLLGYLIGFPILCFYGGVLAFSSLGFLLHNWNPARIFLGDVGSAFLGFSFAAMPFLAGVEHSGKAAPLPVIALFLVWFFVFDTVLTFFSRLVRGHKVWTPHREHLYQRLIISGISHGTVTLVYGLLSFVTVLALASALVMRRYEIMLVVVVFAETLGLVIFALTRKSIDVTH
jgi:UDP-N-acetylmuramyl pentapeptide phosphotransferase/UDP-N-acetylglucosamine-1-phosphate transferase